MESDICGLKSQICHWLALWPWAGDPTSLGLIARLGSESFQGSKTSWGVIRCPPVRERAHSLIWGSKQPWNKSIISTIEKERLRGSAMTCPRSHSWKVQRQGFELETFWMWNLFVPITLAHLHGDSYRSRSGHLASLPPSPTAFCLFLHWCHRTWWGKPRSF